MTKTILITTLATSLLVLAGCTTVPTATNTNEVSNANTNTVNTNVLLNTNENTNATVANENTNTDEGSVDTSDWLTYENDEYGFSFKYPQEWGDIESTSYDTDEYRTGHKTFLSFTDNVNKRASFSIESLDYEFTGPSDGGDIQFDDVNFNLSNSELAEKLTRIPKSSLQITRLTLLGNKSLKINETYLLMDEEYSYTYFLIPSFNNYNLRIVGPSTIEQNIEALVATLQQL